MGHSKSKISTALSFVNAYFEKLWDAQKTNSLEYSAGSKGAGQGTVANFSHHKLHVHTRLLREAVAGKPLSQILPYEFRKKMCLLFLFILRKRKETVASNTFFFFSFDMKDALFSCAV